MDFLKKCNENPYADLKWNIPEQKQGTVAIVGGNLQNFRTPIKVAEFLIRTYPIEAARVILPDALKTKLPGLPDLVFLSSTESGSLANDTELASAIAQTDIAMVVGDLSRNNITARVLTKTCRNTVQRMVITRDAVDLLSSEIGDDVLMNENLILIATMAQLQKLLRAIYYPKMLMMTQPLTQVAETLHKFTLSYPVKIITLHNEQVLIAENGEVAAVPLEKSGYSPLTLWGGEFAAKITAYNMFNPGNFFSASICATYV